MKTLKVPPTLISLRIDLSSVTSLAGAQAVGICLTTITNILDTQPLLEELIFDGIPPFLRFDHNLVFPRVLAHLKRLAFYRCHRTSICHIISLIQHTPILAIAIDLGRDWSLMDVDRATVSQFLANTIPTSRDGYTCSNIDVAKWEQPLNTFHPSSHAVNVILTGPGAAYKLTAYHLHRRRRTT